MQTKNGTETMKDLTEVVMENQLKPRDPVDMPFASEPKESESMMDTSRDDYYEPTDFDNFPTLDESPEERKKKAWLSVMTRAGIPPRYQEAHMTSNCDRYGLEPGKVKAWESARTWASNLSIEQRGRERFCLLISGEFGGGKTWLSTAAFKQVLFHSKVGIWRKFYQFIREIQGAYSKDSDKSVDELIRSYQRTPVLMLDDVGDLEISVQSEDRRRLFYEVIDARNDHFLPTIITTNLSPDELAAQFTERSMERVLEMCAMVSMSGKNLRIDE